MNIRICNFYYLKAEALEFFPCWILDLFCVHVGGCVLLLEEPLDSDHFSPNPQFMST